jgi:hypothetical protein
MNHEDSNSDSDTEIDFGDYGFDHDGWFEQTLSAIAANGKMLKIVGWGDASMIHGWFVKSCMNGVDMQGTCCVTKACVERLLVIVNKITEVRDPKLSFPLLPVYHGVWNDDVYHDGNRDYGNEESMYKSNQYIDDFNDHSRYLMLMDSVRLGLIDLLSVENVDHFEYYTEW